MEVTCSEFPCIFGMRQIWLLSKRRREVLFQTYILVTYYFELYMVPMALAIVLLIVFINVNLSKFSDEDEDEQVRAFKKYTYRLDRLQAIA